MSESVEVITRIPPTIVESTSYVSVPAGGLAGQVLVKASNGSYDFAWTNVSGAGGSNTNLSISNKTSTTFDLNSSTGTDVTIPQATTSEAGLLSATNLVKINNLATVATSGLYSDVVGLQAQLDAKQAVLGFTPYNATNPAGYTSNVGTVTGASIVSANGFNGSVANSNTTPAITIGTPITGLLKGNGTAISAVVSGTDIKTINGNSLLGSGDIAIAGGGSTNLTTTLAPTTVTINSDTGIDAIIPAADGTNAGIMTSAMSVKLAGLTTTSSTTDTTTGRLVKVGDFGVGAAPIDSDNWDTLIATGRYRNTSTGATGIPASVVGIIVGHTFLDSNTAYQVACNITNGNTYTRAKAAGIWGSWVNTASQNGITRVVVVSSGNFIAEATAYTDYVYLLAGAHSPTLPTSIGNTNRYTFKNNHSAAITISTTSSQTIDGTTTISIAPQASVDLISTGSNWSII